MARSERVLSTVLRRLERSPSFWHYVSLGAGLVTILYLQRDQWFFFDEWVFLLVDGPDLWAAHVGHWSTSPTLIYDGLRAVFGLHTYFPFALLVTLLHLSAAHLAWRISLNCGANPWLATTGALIFVFFGTGAENIFWAFQIGYIGALVFGLLAFYLSLAAKISVLRFVCITAISLFSLTWSGTSIPLVVATVALMAWRHGWRRGVILGAVTAAAYLIWYALYSLGTGPDTGGFGLHKLGIAMPQFIGVMLILGFGDIFPIPGLGFVVLLALGVWVVITIRRRINLPRALPTIFLIGGAAVFALLTAFSRATMSVGSGRSSRYVYLVTLLLLPALTVALTHVLRGRRPAILIASLLLVALAGYQTSVLVQASAIQAKTEQSTKRLLSAALDLYLKDTPGLRLDASPDSRWAPDVQMHDLVDLYDAGYFTESQFTDADLKKASANVVVAP